MGDCEEENYGFGSKVLLEVCTFAPYQSSYGWDDAEVTQSFMRRMICDPLSKLCCQDSIVSFISAVVDIRILVAASHSS